MPRRVDMFRRQVITMAHGDIPKIGIYLLGSVASFAFGAWATTSMLDFHRKTRQARRDSVFYKKFAAKQDLAYINDELEVAKMDLAKLRARQI